MKTYKISLECDEKTANILIGTDGKEVNGQWLKIITVADEKVGKIK